jgi:hypothetical protein
MNQFPDGDSNEKMDLETFLKLDGVQVMEDQIIIDTTKDAISNLPDMITISKPVQKTTSDGRKYHSMSLCIDNKPIALSYPFNSSNSSLPSNSSNSSNSSDRFNFSISPVDPSDKNTSNLIEYISKIDSYFADPQNTTKFLSDRTKYQKK